MNDVDKVIRKVRCLSALHLLQQGAFLNFITDVVVQTAKTTLSARFVQRMTPAVALCATSLSAVYADNLSIKTMIPDIPQIDAESYTLTDYNSGRILAKQNAGTRHDPASLTKMATSYVISQAVKAGKFKEADLVAVGNDAWATGNPVFRGSSLMSLRPGMQVPISQLIRGINLQSEGDVCVAVTDFAAGSQDVFVGLTNNYVNVSDLGSIHLQTVRGLNADGQYSSACDVAIIGQALIHDVPSEYSVYKEKELTFNGIRQLNRNGLPWDNSLNVDSIKTGHIDKAGYNPVASATEGQMRLVSTVMDDRTYKGRETGSKKLLTWDSRFLEAVNPLKVDRKSASEPAWFSNTDRASLGVDKDVYLTIPRGRMKDLKAGYVLNTTELHVPLQRNQAVGIINFRSDGKTVEQHPLVVLQEASEGNFFGKIIDYIKLVSHHWFG